MDISQVETAFSRLSHACSRALEHNDFNVSNECIAAIDAARTIENGPDRELALIVRRIVKALRKYVKSQNKRAGIRERLAIEVVRGMMAYVDYFNTTIEKEVSAHGV